MVKKYFSQNDSFFNLVILQQLHLINDSYLCNLCEINFSNSFYRIVSKFYKK